MSKTVVITGGNSGIGLSIAHELARHGATVCLACRDQAKAAAARDEILARTPGARIELYKLDLASFDAIRAFVREFNSRHERLDALINNAGAVPTRQQIDGGHWVIASQPALFAAHVLAHIARVSAPASEAPAGG